MEKDSTRASARPTRTPVGYRNRLTITNQDPNYVYRWVVDRDDKIGMCEAAGYEVVDYRNHKDGSTKRANVGATGDNMVSVGSGEKAVLMRQLKEYYDDDQKAKQQHLNELEDAMRNPSLEGSYGSVKIS